MRSIGMRILWLIVLATLAISAVAQVSGGVAPSQPSVKLLRSISGPRGAEREGRYMVEDARSVFYVPADKQIVVYFEFEGLPGKHHFEGFWKNPEGKAVVFSDFSYDSPQKRFGAFWKLDLSESIAPGVWTLEAHVDGELAGSHSFQIVAAPRPTEAAQPARPLLTPSEVYTRLLKASLFVDNLNAAGTRQSRGSGFFVDDGLVLTAFEVIDGATALRVTLPDGRTLETHEVAAWNRLQDWALLKVTVAAPGKLPRATTKSWAVGDRCFSLGIPGETSRVLIDENVVGINAVPDVGERLNVSNPAQASAAGAPVVNEYGEAIAVLGTSLYPGFRVDDDGAFTVGALREGGVATPINFVALPDPGAPAKTLAELASAGEFVPYLVKSPDLLYGALASSFDPKSRDFPTSRQSKPEFSRKDGRLGVAVIWNPKSKLQGQVALAIYDLNNHPLVESQPTKIKMSAGEYLRSVWNLNVTPLRVGGYRAEVLLDGRPVWRSYFRMTD